MIVAGEGRRVGCLKRLVIRAGVLARLSREELQILDAIARKLAPTIARWPAKSNRIKASHRSGTSGATDRFCLRKVLPSSRCFGRSWQLSRRG